MTAAEEWRPVVGYEGMYAVSSHGRIMSFRREQPRILRPARCKDGSGYLSLFLGKGNGRYVHHLVAEAFVGPRPVGMEIRHLDGDRDNNSADNLKYGTPRENQLDRLRHGTHHNAIKTHCKRGHPFDETNTRRGVRKGRPTRTCRLCSDKSTREARHRRQLRAAGITEQRAA